LQIEFSNGRAKLQTVFGKVPDPLLLKAGDVTKVVRVTFLVGKNSSTSYRDWAPAERNLAFTVMPLTWR
jgi:hypothetical protein